MHLFFFRFYTYRLCLKLYDLAILYKLWKPFPAHPLCGFDTLQLLGFICHCVTHQSVGVLFPSPDSPETMWWCCINLLSARSSHFPPSRQVSNQLHEDCRQIELWNEINSALRLCSRIVFQAWGTTYDTTASQHAPVQVKLKSDQQ